MDRLRLNTKACCPQTVESLVNRLASKMIQDKRSPGPWTASWKYIPRKLRTSLKITVRFRGTAVTESHRSALAQVGGGRLERA